MICSLIKSKEETRAEHQEMIRAIERAGLTRTQLAIEFGIHKSNFDQVMSESSTYALPARIADGMRSLCASYGQVQFVASLLRPSTHVATDTWVHAD